MNEPISCVIDKKRTFDKNVDQRIIVYLDSLQAPLDSLGYLVSPSIIKLRPFKEAPRIELAYLRTHLYEVWFPYLPFYRFSPDREALVIKAERLLPANTSTDQFVNLLKILFSNNYVIDKIPSNLPDNMLFCKCTNPPEEEQAILERKEFAEKILERFFKISDTTAEKLDNIMLIVDDYLEKFHTQHLPILYYTLAGAAGDFELVTAMLSAVAGQPEALGIETLAMKGDIFRAAKQLKNRQEQLKELLMPGSSNNDAKMQALIQENNQLKRYLQQMLQQQKQQGDQSVSSS